MEEFLVDHICGELELGEVRFRDLSERLRSEIKVIKVALKLKSDNIRHAKVQTKDMWESVLCKTTSKKLYESCPYKNDPEMVLAFLTKKSNYKYLDPAFKSYKPVLERMFDNWSTWRRFPEIDDKLVITILKSRGWLSQRLTKCDPYELYCIEPNIAVYRPDLPIQYIYEYLKLKRRSRMRYISTVTKGNPFYSDRNLALFYIRTRLVEPMIDYSLFTKFYGKDAEMMLELQRSTHHEVFSYSKVSKKNKYALLYHFFLKNRSIYMRPETKVYSQHVRAAHEFLDGGKYDGIKIPTDIRDNVDIIVKWLKHRAFDTHPFNMMYLNYFDIRINVL